MPLITDKTERYLVQALVEEDGKMVYKQWKCPSLDYMPGLHPSFAELSKNYFRHRVKYRHMDGSLHGRVRKPRDTRHIHVERINWIRDDPNRKKKADELTASDLLLNN